LALKNNHSLTEPQNIIWKVFGTVFTKIILAECPYIYPFNIVEKAMHSTANSANLIFHILHGEFPPYLELPLQISP
jgi:hypothetical protein